MAMYVFPYNNLDAAIQDGFAKIGGKDKAFTMLKRGHYNVNYHADQVKSDKALLKAIKADPNLQKRIVDAQANKQLGRTGTK